MNKKRLFRLVVVNQVHEISSSSLRMSSENGINGRGVVGSAESAADSIKQVADAIKKDTLPLVNITLIILDVFLVSLVAYLLFSYFKPCPSKST